MLTIFRIEPEMPGKTDAGFRRCLWRRDALMSVDVDNRERGVARCHGAATAGKLPDEAQCLLAWSCLGLEWRVLSFDGLLFVFGSRGSVHRQSWEKVVEVKYLVNSNQ